MAIAFFFFNVQNSITQWLIFFSNTLIKIKLYFCFTNAIFSLIPLRRLGVVLFLLSLSSLFSSAPFVVSVSSEFCFHFFFFLMNLFRLFIKLEALLFYHVTLVVPRCPFTFKSEKLNRWLKNSACLGGIYLSIGATHCSAVGLWKKISASVGLLALGWSSLQRIFQYVVWSLHSVVNSLGIEKGRSGFH